MILLPNKMSDLLLLAIIIYLPSEFWRETDDGRTMVPDLSRDVAMKPTPN
jgi:hypothetical protein